MFSFHSQSLPYDFMRLWSHLPFIRSLLLSHLFRGHHAFALLALRLPLVDASFPHINIRTVFLSSLSLVAAVVNRKFGHTFLFILSYRFLQEAATVVPILLQPYHLMESAGYWTRRKTPPQLHEEWLDTVASILLTTFFHICHCHSFYCNFIPAVSCLNQRSLLQWYTRCESCSGFASLQGLTCSCHPWLQIQVHGSPGLSIRRWQTDLHVRMGPPLIHATPQKGYAVVAHGEVQSNTSITFKEWDSTLSWSPQSSRMSRGACSTERPIMATGSRTCMR